MAASLIIELESGTSTGRVHPHNGYYSGDTLRQEQPTASADTR